MSKLKNKLCINYITYAYHTKNILFILIILISYEYQILNMHT